VVVNSDCSTSSSLQRIQWHRFIPLFIISNVEDIPNEAPKSLREIARLQSVTGDQGMLKCDCKGGCKTKRCKCKQANVLWVFAVSDGGIAEGRWRGSALADSITLRAFTLTLTLTHILILTISLTRPHPQFATALPRYFVTSPSAIPPPLTATTVSYVILAVIVH